MESGSENQNNVASEHQADDETLTSDEISKRRLNSDVWVDFKSLDLLLIVSSCLAALF